METVYLDNAATTAMRYQVKEALIHSMEQFYANPSATYAIARRSKATIEYARKKIASYIGVEPAEVIFTSGGTESNNLILNTAVRDLGVQHVITSKIEHHAVLKVIELLAKEYSIKVSYLPILENGDVCIKTLDSLLASAEKKVMVSLLHINNEIGTILDLEKVGQLCKEHDALFHSDTVQSIGHLTLDLKSCNIHFAAASAHKFYGPKGIGFAIIRKNIGAKALISGGEQERGMRAGTEAIHQITAMAEALKLCCENIIEETAYISSIKKYAIESLKNNITGVSFNALSDKESRKHNLLNICLPISNEKATIVLFQLDMEGIYCSRGSACQSGSSKPSHVLAEFLPKDKLSQLSLRFSFSIYTTKKEIDYMVAKLIEILAKNT